MPTLTLCVPRRAPLPPESYHLGSNRSPAGSVIGVDAVSLWRDGVRWMPVMGELHYARVHAATWREELLKLRAGGIECVATYVFWIHHEETEGLGDWSGDRDLRRFVATAAEAGLQVVVRLGPWCHGEVRNGGLPDWVSARFGDQARTDAPGYLAVVRRHYAAIARELAGWFWKDGGPIIACQIENEFSGPAEHLLTLKRLAREVGLDAPLYTRTGWPDLTTPMPFGELLPLYGAYPEGFWDRELTPMPGFYRANFRFSPLRTDSAIATDLLGQREAADAPDTARYPFLTCEIGGGMMSSYHRRIRIDPRDIEAVVLTKIGDGGNLPGYYMYHGGINPEGRSSLQESQATRYWNDLPEKNYDFQAPIGAAGQLRPHYHRLRRLHLLVRDYGSLLAGLPAVFPEQRPTALEDVTTPRWAVRSDGTTGFVFINNYERLRVLPAKPDLSFALELDLGRDVGSGGRLCFPAVPVTFPAGAAAIWPFGLELAPGVRLRYATAQLLCTLDDEAVRVVFFAATAGVPVEFAFDDDAPVVLAPGRDVAHRNGGLAIVVLDEADSLALYKMPWRGRERVFLSRAGLVADGDELRVTFEDAADRDVWVFPALDSLHEAARECDPLFTSVALFSPAISRGSSAGLHPIPLRPAGPARGIPLGWTTPAVAVAPTDSDFGGAAAWRIALPANLDVFETPILRIAYVGDVLRVRHHGRLLCDDFYNGDVFELDLTRYAAALVADPALEVEILPLAPDAPILLPAGLRPAVATAELHSVTLVEVNTVRAL